MREELFFFRKNFLFENFACEKMKTFFFLAADVPLLGGLVSVVH